MANSMTSTSVTSVDDLRIMTNNSGAVVHLLAGLLAVLGHDVLALLDVGRVHHHVVLFVTYLLVEFYIQLPSSKCFYYLLSIEQFVFSIFIFIDSLSPKRIGLNKDYVD